jgi:hypothetical protein
MTWNAKAGKQMGYVWFDVTHCPAWKFRKRDGAGYGNRALIKWLFAAQAY